MSAPRKIRAVNVIYKKGNTTVDLFKGDDLPEDAPQAFVDALDEQGSLEPLPYDEQSVEQLQATADRLGVAVKGSGKDGNVVKSDLVDALSARDAQSE